MVKVFLTSAHCQYLILETTESTGKFIHYPKTCTLLFEMITQLFLFLLLLLSCISWYFSIPDEITVLKNLERLDLANNDISG